MEKNITKLLLLSLFSFANLSYALGQDVLFPGIRNLNRKIIVQDSTGKIYSDAEWMSLTTKYQYKFTRLDSTAEILVYKLSKMNEQDKKELLSKIQPEETHNFKNGDKLISFKLNDVNGNRLIPDSLKGKIAVLYFCILESPATRYEVYELNDLYEKYKNRKDVVFVAITSEDSRTVKNFIKRTGFRFPVCQNANFVMKQLDIYAWPTHVVLDKSGSVQLHNMTYNPELSVFWISNKIDELLQKKD